jgi:hypothetical protein
MMARITVLSALMALTGLSSAAEAKPGRVDRVIFEGRAKTLDFTVTATTELDASKAEALPDKTGKVLILRIGGVTAKRRWVKAKDPELKRVLLHASTERPPGAVLRVRFKKKVVNRDLMKRISVFVEDEGIRISVPRPSVPAEMDAKKSKGRTVMVAGVSSPPPTATGIGGGSATDIPRTSTTGIGGGSATDIPRTLTTGIPGTSAKGIPRTSATEAPIGGLGTTRPGVVTSDSRSSTTMTPTGGSLGALGATAAPITPIGSSTASSASASSVQSPDPSNQVNITTPPGSAISDPADATTSNADLPNATGLVFMPGVRTQDILAGFTDMSLRLETGMKSRPGVHRIAILPFLALDDDAKQGHVGPVSQAVMTNRLSKRTGIVQTDSLLLERTIAPLQRDDMGRFDLNEARAAGVSVGADTLIIGTASTNGNGYTVDTRAIDVQTGKRLGVVSQEFEHGAFHDYANRVRLERTYGGTLLRSAALPGWGQLYQGEAGRGAVYMTIFSAALLAGLTSAYLGSAAESTYRSSDKLEDVALREDANDFYSNANTFFLGSGMVWLTAMIDSVFTGDTQVILDPELYGAVE